jgi:4-diphosphocytidyl-2-C-methyl-D-erythritol kinase
VQSLTVRSFAKINWMLRILERRPDGFHRLETIFQTISLHDLITCRRSVRLEITCDDPSIPTDESNLAYRAAAMMREKFDIDPVHIEIRKAIPAGGGLGGGSSNAAMTLLALDKMFALGAPMEALVEIAGELGSDVPFFLVGGTAWGTGRGDQLQVLPPPPPLPLLLLIPDDAVSTAEAYRRLAEARARGEIRVPRTWGVDRAEWIIRGGLADLGAHLVNDFEPVVFPLLPRLRELKEALLNAGASFALMSGSGSAIFGAFRAADTRDGAAPHFGVGVRAVACEPVTAHETMRDLR